MKFTFRYVEFAVLIEFQDRASDSAYIERVWRSRSLAGGSFLSMAEPNLELVVTRISDQYMLTLRGPVTRGSLVECPANGEWTAIRFQLGTVFPGISVRSLMDHHNLDLPVVSGDRFWFANQAWEIPTFQSAEQLVSKWASAGIIVLESSMAEMLSGVPISVCTRTLQRHFHRITGMTASGLQQIERARLAATMLVDGTSVLDATFAAGYFDQAHLTRSLRHFVGMTPASLSRHRPQLSFSYKTLAE